MSTTLHTDEVKDALLSLGNTADEIAASFRDKGIKGRCHDSSSCPVANFLYGTFEIIWATVDLDGIAFMDDARFHDFRATGAYLATPTPVADFVARFDVNYYPDLVE